MENYYSIVRFVNNPFSEESIALGLVVLISGKEDNIGTDGAEAQVLFRLSSNKTAFAKKLNPGSARLLDFSLKQLHSFLVQDVKEQSGQVVQFPVRVKRSFLERLSNYNNGLLQFSKPRYIESDNIGDAFDDYFARFIEPRVESLELIEKPAESRLQVRVKKDFHFPLRGKIDVDYTLQKSQLPTLFFDYHLDGIGVNGAMYAVKAIDLNSRMQIDTIYRELSEYESVIERLDLFAEKRGISGKAQYNLIVDPYEGNNSDRRDLYKLLIKNDMPSFMVMDSAKLPVVVQEFRRQKVRKFSEVLKEK